MVKEFTTNSKPYEKTLVGCLWQDASKYDDISNHNITKNSFASNRMFALFLIGRSMYEKGIRQFDKMTTTTFLAEKTQLRGAFEKCGGYDTIKSLLKSIDKNDRVEKSINEVMKYEGIRKLYNQGMINDSEVHKEDDNGVTLAKKLEQMTLEQVKSYFGFKVDNAFDNINSGNYDIIELNADLLRSAVKRAKDGVDVGMDIYGAPMLTKAIKGISKGRMLLLGSESGLGKSTILRNLFLTTFIQNNSKAIVFVNEESVDDWANNLTIAMTNYIYKQKGSKPIYKENIMSGNFLEDDDNNIDNAIERFEDESTASILIIPLKTYRFDDVISNIKKYAMLGYEHILFDTFKPDTKGSKNKERWERFTNMSQELYDLIKPENLNMSITASIQLKIGNRDKYVTHSAIGKSKEVVEVADITMLFRKMYTNEFPDDDDMAPMKDKNVIEVKGKFTKVDGEWINPIIELDPKKKYLICFFGKNRKGKDFQQIVFEIDHDTNRVKEIGFTEVKEVLH